MKFIVDAQLPYGVAQMLRERGFDVVHTNDLPDKERTTDDYIREISIRENRIVITKDYDFLNTHILKSVPQKLLIIATGNIKNKQLFELLNKNWQLICGLLQTCDLIEVDNDRVIGK